MEQKDTVSDTPLTGIHQKFSKIFNYKEVTCEKVALADLVELRNGGRPRLTPRPLFQSQSRTPRKNFVKSEKIRQNDPQSCCLFTDGSRPGPTSAGPYGLLRTLFIP